MGGIQMVKKILIYLSFGILFFLSASSGKLLGYLLIPVGFGVGIGFLLLLKTIIKAFNSKVVQTAGVDSIVTSVCDGFILLIPFAIFALIAVRLFGPGSALPFMSAGLMICGGVAGMELIKIGGGKVANILIPSLYCMATSVLLSYLAAFIQRGGIL